MLAGDKCCGKKKTTEKVKSSSLLNEVISIGLPEKVKSERGQGGQCGCSVENCGW